MDAGIEWPALIAGCAALQSPDAATAWGIRQKQTGADRLTLGGALAANIHGRGLRLPPIVGDVEAFTLIGPDGLARPCSRDENADLFRLAIGGYGLFGVIAEVTLRLMPRVPVQRSVEILTLDELVRVAAGLIRFFLRSTSPVQIGSLAIVCAESATHPIARTQPFVKSSRPLVALPADSRPA